MLQEAKGLGGDIAPGKTQGQKTMPKEDSVGQQQEQRAGLGGFGADVFGGSGKAAVVVAHAPVAAAKVDCSAADAVLATKTPHISEQEARAAVPMGPPTTGRAPQAAGAKPQR